MTHAQPNTAQPNTAPRQLTLTEARALIDQHRRREAAQALLDVIDAFNDPRLTHLTYDLSDTPDWDGSAGDRYLTRLNFHSDTDTLYEMTWQTLTDGDGTVVPNDLLQRAGTLESLDVHAADCDALSDGISIQIQDLRVIASTAVPDLYAYATPGA